MTDLIADKPTGRLLGLDYGTTVIGASICDLTRIVARPLTLIKRSTRVADFATINRLISEQSAVGIVVGIPEAVPEFEGESQADRVQRWAARLAGNVTIPVYLWDETLSSEEAERLIIETGRKMPDRIDDVAAAVILQTFLDEHPSGIPYPPVVKAGRHSGHK
jgi:putative Holliday junction resolvase